jgi:NSS family neurotransmitter:Na+ symporter
MPSSRGQFSSRLGFIMAAAGAAVGLGNIWGFPTQVANNGGAAFVLVYLVLTFFLAYPVFMAELLIGRYGRANIATSLQKMAHSQRHKRFAFIIGTGGIITSALILSFYVIIAGWMISHALEPAARMVGFTELADWTVSDSSLRSILFSAIFMYLTFFIIQKGVEEGIEKWSKRLMPLLIILLILLIAYVLTLEGAGRGLEAYLKPDFSRVFEPDLIISALGQAFFSLGVGAGLTVIYASYVSKKENLVTLGTQVTLIDVGIAFLAGLLIIPAMYVAQAQGIKIFAEDGSLVSGPNVVFNVLPNLFNGMGTTGLFVAVIFFVLMSVAALTSSIAILETLVTYVTERHGLARKKTSAIIAAIILSVSSLIVINIEWMLDLVVSISTEYGLPIIGILSCLFVGWIWHRNEILGELRQGNNEVENSLFWKIWPWYIKFVCPVTIALVFFHSL